ncbi:MAG TPA: polysaccharide deacetylase family protein [Pseudonocardiaceae bacterium]|nr:polysaccharide deacetylase family protein [Pseudonocardiaceae bacterium]
MGLRALLVVLFVAALGVGVPGVAAAAQHRTVVSLTFDDGDADQVLATGILAAHRMPATYYVITGAVGSPGYLTLDQVHHLAALGNEIGGHTVSHLDLTQVSLAEARRQVCQSRQTLTGWGFRVRSFAYPDGSANAALHAVVRDCGYDSARLDGGLRSPGCADCAAADPLRPRDRYAVPTPPQVDTSWTLADLKHVVTVAERTGGWVPLVFHHVCATSVCGPLSVRTSTLRAFAGWLAHRTARGTQVRTVGQVIGGKVAPVVRSAAVASHGVVNGSLETVGAYDASQSDTGPAPPARTVPRCWSEAGYGDNKVVWRHVRGGHGGTWAEQLTMTGHRSGDAKLLQRFDLGECAPTAVAGAAYRLTAWYHGTVAPQFSVYYRESSGRWVYWTSSPFFAPSHTWKRATWRTPPLPAGGSAVSFGLAVTRVGTLTTDGYRIAPAPPVAAAGGGVSLSLTAALLAGGALVVVALYFVRPRRRQIALAARSNPPSSSR